MADTRSRAFLRIAGSSSPPAANPQVEGMIGVSDPYRVRKDLDFAVRVRRKRRGNRGTAIRVEPSRLADGDKGQSHPSDLPDDRRKRS
jgi:hypothetical protein